MDFETYWTLFRPDEQFKNRREAAEQEWNKHPEKHEAILAWLRKHGAYSGRNPYFFIQDFQVKQPRQQVLTYSAYYAKYYIRQIKKYNFSKRNVQEKFKKQQTSTRKFAAFFVV